MARYDLPTTTTTAATMVPEIVLAEVQATAAREEVFMPLARRIELSGPGDVFHYAQGGALTWNTMAGGDNPAEQAFTTAARSLTPQLRQLDVIVGIEVLQGTVADVIAAIAKEAGIGLAASRDGGFGALYTEAVNPAGELGTDGVSLSFTSLRSGLDYLYGQQAPRRFAWVVYPTQWAGELLLDDTLINASVKGSPVLTQGMQAGGFVTSVLDCDIYVSDKIVESSGRHSMMFSKNAAIGYGFKMIEHPITKNKQEVLMDMDWNSGRRCLEVNMTYFADFEGLKGSSPTTNNWMVDIKS